MLADTLHRKLSANFARYCVRIEETGLAVIDEHVFWSNVFFNVWLYNNQLCQTELEKLVSVFSFACALVGKTRGPFVNHGIVVIIE